MSYDGSGVAYNVSRIPEFRVMAKRPERRDRKVPTVIEQFWGAPVEYQPGVGWKIVMWNVDVPAGLKLLLRGMNIHVQRSTYGIHPAAMWYICDYLGLPHHTQNVEKVKKVMLQEMRQTRFRQITHHMKYIASLETKSDKQEIFDKSTRDTVKVIQMYIERLKETIDTILPFVFRADNTKLETARIGAIWSILLFELKMVRVTLAEYMKPQLPMATD